MGLPMYIYHNWYQFPTGISGVYVSIPDEVKAPAVTRDIINSNLNPKFTPTFIRSYEQFPKVSKGCE